LVSIAARGRNYLLNGGPTPEGMVPEEAALRLNEIGKWLSVYGEAIYGTQRSLIYPEWGECTRKDIKNNSVLYLCVFNWPINGKLVLNANYKVKKASLLNNHENLKVNKMKKQIIIDVPRQAPDNSVSIVKLELNEKLPIREIVSNTTKYFRIIDDKK
jgi:alpha-L-fucosidase